jgi:hypothetical protein
MYSTGGKPWTDRPGLPVPGHNPPAGEGWCGVEDAKTSRIETFESDTPRAFHLERAREFAGP